MFTSADEVLSYIQEEGVEMVDVRFCDLPGVMQHFTVPAGSFDADVFADGLGFDGSSVRGFQEIHESDMLLLPDVTTARLDPFRTRKTLILIDQAGHHGQMLPFALGIGEAQVDPLDLLLLDHAENRVRIVRHWAVP